MQRTQERKYFLIDPWRHQDEKLYHQEVNYSQEGFEHSFAECRARLMPFEGRYVFMRMLSEQAVHYIGDEALDWDYIDANHSLPTVAQDLALWSMKVRPGGIIAGHDFLDKGFPDRFGVRTAVEQFFPMDYEVHTSDTEWPIWWAVKPLIGVSNP
jgi:hypothetical protein